MDEFPGYLLKEKSHHVTVLSQQFQDRMSEMRADLSSYGATLFRFVEDGKTKNFPLTDDEADAFVASWTAFRTQQHEEEQAEIRRLEEAKEQAFAIAKSCSAISIKTTDHADIWIVTLGEVIYTDGLADRVYGPDELLNCVQRAKHDWDEEQRIEIEVQEAYRVADQVEGIAIEGDGGQFWLTVFGRRRWSTAKDLNETLKDMVNTHITALLNDHPTIELKKIAEKTNEQKAVWSLTRDGTEVCTAQGLVEILKSLGQVVAETITT
jgi:hypothetical protein